MSAKNTSRDTPQDPAKDNPACRGQDAREGAHNDDTDATANNSSTFDGPTNGIAAFLWWIGDTGRLDEIDDLETDLRDHYEDWQEFSKTKQAELEGWQ